MAQQPYIHGTAPEEQRRLSLMNTLINEACLRSPRFAPGAAALWYPICWAEGVREG